MAIVFALPERISPIVINEIQKVPKLLDIVHALIEKTKIIFVLTGSSARKLKRGGANLLAGRAFVYHLFPLSSVELNEPIDLVTELQFGQLPKILSFSKQADKARFLMSYASTYLKEEIAAEQIVKNLAPFRRFFDTGVVRALARMLSVPLVPKTSAYGQAFEHLVIIETMRLASYFYPEFRFSYIRTKDDAEIDLVVERPGKPLLCIEIKSSADVTPKDLTSFIALSKDIPHSEAICLCNERTAKKYDSILVLPWQEGLRRYFMPTQEIHINH